jgi:ankyrin repeat protein
MLPTLDALIACGANVNAEMPSGETALGLAAMSGSADAVRLLFTHGAKASKNTMGGWSPLLGAAQSGSAETVRLLLAHGVDASGVDGIGRTPLMAAIQAAPQRSAFIVNGKSKTQNLSPQEQSRMKGYVEIVRLLLSHGADVNARDRMGNTAMKLAMGKNMPVRPMQQSKPEIIAALKQAEPDPRSQP